MPKPRKKPSAPKLNGDHGTGTHLACAGTVLEKMDGPNNMARRRRRPQSEAWKPKLSMRQWQASIAIEEAYCRVQMLSSGGEVKERVDASPKPDATAAAQVDAISRLRHVMADVPGCARPVIEHLFWHNKPLSDFRQEKEKYDRVAEMKVALDLTANRLRY